MRTLIQFAMSLPAAPAFAHSGAAEHVHPHIESHFPGLVVAALLLLGAGVAFGPPVLAALRRPGAKKQR